MSCIMFCVVLRNALVSWKTKKQSNVATSSLKAEYRSLATAIKDMLWTFYILRELHLHVHLPILIYCDNKSTLVIVCNPCLHGRIKYIDIDILFVRDHVQAGYQPWYIPSKLQLVDLLTKSLPNLRIEFLCSKLHFI